MVFYLQSRGLDRLQARSLLLEGWARSLMTEVPSEAVKARIAAKAAKLGVESQAVSYTHLRAHETLMNL
eukprot:489165-Prymnesium_polylepis.1